MSPGARKSLQDLVRANIPAALTWAMLLLVGAVAGFLEQNWWLLFWLVIPVAVLAWPRDWPPRLEFRRRFALELPPRWAYVAAGVLFIVLILALLPFTNPQSSLQGFAAERPRNFLGLGRWGDWKFWFARRVEPSSRLAVMLVDPRPPEVPPDEQVTLAQLRRALCATLVELKNMKASGVALDYFFNRNSEYDSFLSGAVRHVRGADGKFPVFASFDFEVSDGVINYVALAPGLEHAKEGDEERGCFEWERDLGHIMVYREDDGRVRSIPLGFLGAQNEPALSVRIASSIRGSGWEPPQPPGGLLFFVPPGGKGVPVVRCRFELDQGGDLVPVFTSETGSLTRRMILIGTDTDQDSLLTPFSQERLRGVMLHAYATEALLADHYLIRPSWWWALLGAVFPSLNLAARFAWRDNGWKRLGLITIGITALFFGISAGLVYVAGVWIDVAYAVLAIWLMFGAGLVARRFGLK